VQIALSNAEAAAKLSTQKNPSNSLNWLSLASVYEQILPLGVKGAYENAKGAVTQALVLNPKNPGLYLRLARLEAFNKNIPGAKDDIQKALQLKPNYPDAIVMLSQLYVAEGNYDQAISLIENLVSFYPNDKDLANYLNQLKAQTAKPATP
jgi:cytochrome c-type biogenesis protein CcmH/NrfG